MKFELAGGAINALEELEEVKCLKVNSGQIAFVYFCHIYMTVERVKSGLQNEVGIIGERAPAFQNLPKFTNYT